MPSTSTVASSVCATTTDRRVPVVGQAPRQVIDGSSASNCPVTTVEHTSAATGDSEARQIFKDGGISGSDAAGTAATTAGQGSRLTLRRISVVSKALPDTERDRRGHERCDDDEASWPTDWLAAATQAPVSSTTTTEDGVRGSGSEEMDHSHAVRSDVFALMGSESGVSRGETSDHTIIFLKKRLFVRGLFCSSLDPPVYAHLAGAWRRARKRVWLKP